MMAIPAAAFHRIDIFMPEDPFRLDQQAAAADIADQEDKGRVHLVGRLINLLFKAMLSQALRRNREFNFGPLI